VSFVASNLSDSEHNQTHATLAVVDVECCFRCVCFVVWVTLGPKAAISRGEQNRYGWRRCTLLTARLINSTAAYGGLWRGLGALKPILMEGGTYESFFKSPLYEWQI